MTVDTQPNPNPQGLTPEQQLLVDQSNASKERQRIPDDVLDPNKSPAQLIADVKAWEKAQEDARKAAKKGISISTSTSDQDFSTRNLAKINKEAEEAEKAFRQAVKEGMNEVTVAKRYEEWVKLKAEKNSTAQTLEAYKQGIRGKKTEFTGNVLTKFGGGVKNMIKGWFRSLSPQGKDKITWALGLGVGVAESILFKAIVPPPMSGWVKSGINALVINTVNSMVGKEALRRGEKAGKWKSFVSGLAAGSTAYAIGTAVSGVAENWGAKAHASAVTDTTTASEKLAELTGDKDTLEIQDSLSKTNSGVADVGGIDPADTAKINSIEAELNKQLTAKGVTPEAVVDIDGKTTGAAEAKIYSEADLRNAAKTAFDVDSSGDLSPDELAKANEWVDHRLDLQNEIMDVEQQRQALVGVVDYNDSSFHKAGGSDIDTLTASDHSVRDPLYASDSGYTDMRYDTVYLNPKALSDLTADQIREFDPRNPLTIMPADAPESIRGHLAGWAMENHPEDYAKVVELQSDYLHRLGVIDTVGNASQAVREVVLPNVTDFVNSLKDKAGEMTLDSIRKSVQDYVGQTGENFQDIWNQVTGTP